jgi:putative colanic acid biosynthesis UDP-glucose lipid carrier transferase
MISQRTRGLQKTLLICQGVIAVLLLCATAEVTFTFITAVSLFHIERYPIYAGILIGGLVLESAKRGRVTTHANLLQRNFLDQHNVTLRQVCYAMGALLCYLALFKDQYISRTFMLVYFPALYLALLASNYYLPRVLARRVFRGVHEERTLLIGSPERVANFRDWTRNKELFGVHTVGFLSGETVESGSVEGLRCHGSLAEIESVIRRESVTQVIVLGLPEDREAHRRLVLAVEKLGVRFSILSNLEELLAHPVVHTEDDGMRFITLREEPLENPLNRILKRLLDLAVAIPVVVFLLPPLSVAIWLVQRFQSPGALFYRQTRAGIQNRIFEIIKFRTMRENHGTEARQASPFDDRVFPAGRWMRRFSIDELPQFVNVLKGEMSVTGPRPHLVEHNTQFAEQLSNYHIRAFVKPGITGLAQIRGHRGEARTASDIAQRVASDISYLENWKLALDLSIIARTVWQVLRPPRSAY